MFNKIDKINWTDALKFTILGIINILTLGTLYNCIIFRISNELEDLTSLLNALVGSGVTTKRAAWVLAIVNTFTLGIAGMIFCLGVSIIIDLGENSESDFQEEA